MFEDRPYGDDELRALDLDELFRRGITKPDGTLKDDLAGHGAVAAGLQLEAAGATAADVETGAEALRAQVDGTPPPPGDLHPAVDALLGRTIGQLAGPEDLSALADWLDTAAAVLMIRTRR